jgi:hypothetical protein
MAITTTIGLFLGGATALDSFVQGRSMSNEALRGLEEFEAQKLVNNYEGLTPSLDVERTALDTFNQTEANIYDVAQGQDAAGALAMISQGTEQVNAQRQKTFDQMRKEVAAIDFAAAQDEGVIRNMQEQRDRFTVETLQEQLAAGQEMKYSALEGITKSLIGVGLAKEDRLAGLGIDPVAARKQRIADGTATYADYLNEGQFGELFKRDGKNNRGNNNNAESSFKLDDLNLDKPGINLYNPDGSFRFNLLGE